MLLLGSVAPSACAPAVRPHAATTAAEVVHVAAPTGEREIDRASIMAALEEVRPGGNVQFAPGTYLVGEAIQLPTPRVRLLGHPHGTTLRGCEAAELDEIERKADRESDLPSLFAILLSCGMLELTGGHVTVRDFTFENTRMGLLLGCCHAELAFRPSEGGYRIENNTFRDSGNAIRALLSSAEPTVIRGNRFINVFHALSAGASHVHMLDNDISVPEPQRVAGRGHPGFAIGIWPIPGDFADPAVSDGEDCAHNVIAGNRIEGHETGVVLFGEPGLTCRQNVIRDNTIIVRRVPFDAARWPADAVGITDPADSTIVGVPLTFHNPGGDGRIEDNLLEGNRILGADGIGIEVLRASGNRIANNTITNIRRRDPFPGNTLGGEPQRWAVANGSGIWVSPGSEENEIVGNTFEDVASSAVVLEGDRNVVETRGADELVRDLGSGNRVSRYTDPVEAVRRLTDRFIAAWNDDFPDPVQRFHARDAVLTLAGGTVLEGRDAIVENFFRPNVARIRGMRPSGDTRIEGTGDTITLDGRYRARIAPSPDTVEIRVSNTWALQADGSWLITASTFELPSDDADGPIRSRFIHSDGARLHYLDFGGDGVPLVFLPSANRTAYTYIDFAARFTDRHRVLALTRRGSGQSDGEAAEGVTNVARLARDVLALLDSLGIERAVVVDRWTEIPVYLAEQHADRVAALVVLRGVPPEPDPFELRARDATRLLEMYERAGAAFVGRDADGSGPLREDWYEPRFRRTGEAIEVPTLLFVVESATPREEIEWEFRIGVVDDVASEPQRFPDPVSRSYFQKLAIDEELQAQVQAFYQEVFAPAWRAAEWAFFRAFGDHRIVRLEGENPRNYYQYRHAPDRIEPHIRHFLDDVGARARPARDSGIVHVAPPTGTRDVDRASISAALEQVRPGGTIRFAAGTYMIGEFIDVSVPRVTLAGHADGTTLRGCEPAAFAEMDVAIGACNGLDLTGGHQTVRDLTFEYTWHALSLGGLHCAAGTCEVGDPPMRERTGGYRVEGNTFRESQNGIRVSGQWIEPAVIRGNRFINTYHAVMINGMTAHILDNDIAVPEPDRVVYTHHPGLAFLIGGWEEREVPACDGNVIAGNRISGHPDAIAILVFDGGTCRRNQIRDNIIDMAPVRFASPSTALHIRSDADSTIGGVAIAFLNGQFGEGVIEENVVEGNRIAGSAGVAVELVGASHNRIAGNTISGVTRREPFPGNTLFPFTPAWAGVNGTGIWLSPGSDENEILGNTFTGIAAHAVVLEGDRNVVETRNPGDAVRDLGTGNRVRTTGAGAGAEAPLPDAAAGPAADAGGHGITALHDVDIVDVERGLVIPRQTVLITGNRISAIGSATDVRIPSGAEVVEARGTYLIPGLWDMHVHSSSDRITRATMLPMYIANGITGVRDMHADCFEPCAADRSTIAQVNGWRRDIAAGRLTGPRIVAASDALNGPAPGTPSGVHTPANAEDARAVVRLLHQRGVDLIKIYDMLPREAYFALAEEAKQQRVQFAGHVPVEVRASEASDAGQRSMEHLVGILEACSEREDELRPKVIAQLGSATPRVLSTVLLMADSFSEERCAALFATFVANGTWHVPTLLVHDKSARMAWRESPRLRYVPPEERAVWEEIQKYEIETLWGADPEGFARLHRVMSDIVLAMHRAGVRILAGSDAAWVSAFPGFSLHDELELLVAAGLTPAEALRAATLGPAQYLEATDSLGAVAPGRLADLVLLDANPLDDIRNTQRIRAVFSDGRFFDRHALDELLAGVEEAAAGDEIVHVAPPTGERDADRASIIAALEQVRPGGTVQFAPGTYVIGGMNLDVAVPGIHLLGHTDGTVIRGCDPDVFADFRVARFACNAFGLSGRDQTVRGLVFEYAWEAIVVGCCMPGSVEDFEAWPGPEHVQAGGHVIEGNTFRYTPNGLRVLGRSEAPTVIRDNRFIDVYHAIGINGGGVHFIDNDIAVHEPHRVPTSTHPGDPINISPTGGAGDHTTCSDNVIAGNRIEGHTHGVRIAVFRPNTSCRRNVIRDNTISVQRVPFAAPWVGIRFADEADPTVVGVPVQLVDFTKAEPERYGDPAADAPAVIEGNVIEGNRISGAEGIGIEVLHASRNRIANNVISGIRPREPFPGNVLSEPVQWQDANGSGIWISTGSDENEISGNAFRDVAAHAIVLEGDRNRVTLRSAADPVRDTGSGNAVAHEVEAQLTRFVRALNSDAGQILHHMDAAAGRRLADH